MATRRKRLLAQIDKQIKYWDERRAEKYSGLGI
jgi:hypothetical protein